MRPLQFALCLATSAVTITLLLYAGSPHSSKHIAPGHDDHQGGHFYFHLPPSLFPPSAIISLTDDNSTFFLARPAAYGPLLPHRGLSGQLWIGSGFGLGNIDLGGLGASVEGELGCSDVPGWSPERRETEGKPKIDASSASRQDAVAGSKFNIVEIRAGQNQASQPTKNPMKQELDTSTVSSDGSDDHLHHPLPDSVLSKSTKGALSSDIRHSSQHADIQSLQETAEIQGKIVLLSRGGCGFLEKTKWVQRRGGIALVVGDNVRGGPLVPMYARGDTSNITIPSIFTSHTTAHLLASLMPSGGYIEDLRSESVGKASVFGRLKTSKTETYKADEQKPQPPPDHPMFTPAARMKSGSAAKRGISSYHRPRYQIDTKSASRRKTGLLDTVKKFLGLGEETDRFLSAAENSRRPPSSGHHHWLGDDKKPAAGSEVHKSSRHHTKSPSDDFVIGVQDWRDKEVIIQKTKSADTDERYPAEHKFPHKVWTMEKAPLQGGSITPSSGEYEEVDGRPRRAVGPRTVTNEKSEHGQSAQGHQTRDELSWLDNLLGSAEDEESPAESQESKIIDIRSTTSGARFEDENSEIDENDFSIMPEREGLWITLSPTNTSTNPFFDTLLVLVVSPLVTLSIVYAMLLLRSRLRRRRWRAPKSVVDQLPVRTYQTMSSHGSSPRMAAVGASDTTPLLQHLDTSAPASARPIPGIMGLDPGEPSSSMNENEKRDTALAEWRRRYGSKQVECVVCLEEYVDGVSRVMSLPCGHEFHADCITPWLTTRRRTCPICKGDVVRSLARGDSLPSRTPPTPARAAADVQVQAAESRNDTASAALPIPRRSGAGADLERGPDASHSSETTCVNTPA